MADKTGSQGQQIVEIAVGGLGIAGTPAGGVVTVQGAVAGLSGAVAIAADYDGTAGNDGRALISLAHRAGSWGASNKPLGAASFLFNGATWDRLRTPAVFKSVSATAAGSTTLWTPAAGKKFRLMRFKIEVTANASLAAGAIEIIDLLDAAASIGVAHSVWVPTVAVLTAGGNILETGWIDLGNGYLSTAANAVLNLNLGTALATGACRVIVAGTEE